MKFRFIVGIFFLLMNNLFAYDAERGFEVVLKEMKLENRIALVIGNDNYKGALPSLNNAVNDSKDIGNILRKRGFQVTPLINATKKTMRRAFRAFYQHISNGGVGLVYFAGHGIEFNGKNYLIPTNANLEDSSDVQDEAIALSRIIRKMKASNNRLNIIILDACRNNPYDKERNALGKGGLAGVDLPKGLYVAYSTGAGRTTSDGKQSNGLYTQYLKYYMQQPLLLDQVFKQTRIAVYNKSTSNPKQLPAIYDQVLEGKFYFTFPILKKDETSPIVLKPLDEIIPQFIPNFRVFSSIDERRQNPINANINIENIGTWSKGMKFNKGTYIVKISASNYDSKRYTVKINSNSGYDFELPFQISKYKVASTPKGITPTKSICKSYGGMLSRDGTCFANWKNAHNICSVSGGSLPSKKVLVEVVKDCGGVVNHWNEENMKKNLEKKSYQSCYKDKGFGGSSCWSSTTDSENSRLAWRIDFFSGIESTYYKYSNTVSVRCVRLEE